MDHVVRRLIDTQLPNGYLGTYQTSEQFAQGDGNGWDGPVWDVWTHKYVLIGLLAYHRATGDGPSLDAEQARADPAV